MKVLNNWSIFTFHRWKCYFDAVCTNKNERDRIMVTFCRENDDSSYCVLHASGLHNAIVHPFSFSFSLHVYLLFVRCLYVYTFHSFFFSTCSVFDLSLCVFSLYHSISIFHSDAYQPTWLFSRLSTCSAYSLSSDSHLYLYVATSLSLSGPSHRLWRCVVPRFYPRALIRSLTRFFASFIFLVFDFNFWINPQRAYSSYP
jgi:hypothetical protein